MNSVDVDASEHYTTAGTDDVPSTLALVVDTNPRSWAALSPEVTIDGALANLLAFVNAHLAFNNANEVVVLAAHPRRAEFLFPLRAVSPTTNGLASRHDASDDVVMTDAPASSASSANKVPQFAQLEGAVVSSLRALMTSTQPEDLTCPTSQLGGALSLALARINRSAKMHAAPAKAGGDSTSAKKAAASSGTPFRGRILVLSVSDSEPGQYVPSINAAHAAAHLRIPIDALALAGQATFLQQAASITDGFFVDVPAGGRHGLLALLMFGFVGDPGGRACMVEPSNSAVDFRGACFCHGRLVSEGYVCSTCLSIFCDPPEGGACLTCGVVLALGKYGGKPAVIPRRRKKRKRPANGAAGEAESAAATPRAR
jgi:transcription initiation factor TFIIH subunit 3